MRCAFNFETSILFIALLASNVVLVSAVNCAPADDDGSPLTGSAVAGSFVTCTYQGAGPCTYFPVDGSFSSGASTCPPGLPQGAAAVPGVTTTPVATPTPTPTPVSTPVPSLTTTPEVETTTTPTSTSETTVATTSPTTVTQPPPVTTQTSQTTAPSTTTSAASTPQTSSLGVFTSSSPSIITATTVIIVSALVGLPNFLGIAYAYASV